MKGGIRLKYGGIIYDRHFKALGAEGRGGGVRVVLHILPGVPGVIGACGSRLRRYPAYTTDTRFGTAQEHAARLFDITGKTVLHEITTTEPIGPKKMFDVLLVAPCTGNTLAKLAAGIVDTPVCMAVKSHLRNQRPVVIAVSTNDALAGAAKNIGTLRNYRNFYFVPIFQDDPVAKPFSMISDFNRIPQTIEAALSGVQIQPMITTVQ